MVEEEMPKYDPSRLRLLKYLALGFGGVMLISAVADEEVRRAFSYDSYPPHFLGWEKLARAIVQVGSKYTLDGMMAHQWDWMNMDHPNSPYFVNLTPDP